MARNAKASCASAANGEATKNEDEPGHSSNRIVTPLVVGGSSSSTQVGDDPRYNPSLASIR